MTEDSAAYDTLLDGRVRLYQPTTGYRAAIDPVLLAAAVPACAGERVLDIGVGSGAAALCLLARQPEVQIVGLEKHRQSADLLRRNVAANERQANLQVVEGDITAPPPEVGQQSFDHVMTNPPYGRMGEGRPPPDPAKAAAHVETSAKLAAWLDFCIRRTRSRGTVTVIHRAERLAELLAVMSGRLGGLVVFPLWPGQSPGQSKEQDKAARRVIVHGRKDTKTPLILSPGLVLHQDQTGNYTTAAEAVLRDAQPLSLVP